MRILSLVAFTLLLLPLRSLAHETKTDDITFAEHIAPLVFDNCTTCHRPGQVAPFSLMNYADVRKRAKTMLRVMEERYMPPWQPERSHIAAASTTATPASAKNVPCRRSATCVTH